MKRMLDCTAADCRTMTRPQLLAALAGSEGRTLVCETIGTFTPLLGDITNAECAAALGADLLILNLFDVNAPEIKALPPVPPEETIREIKRLTGRPVAINLEPAPEHFENGGTVWAMTDGRRATVENARRAAAMGVDMIVLTGNPGVGVSNSAIVAALQSIRAALGDTITLAAGKMHAAGVVGEEGEAILTDAEITAFAAAGADIIVMPAPGTVPGLTEQGVHALIRTAHKAGCLVMTTIGTSQEGADEATIRHIALSCKTAGADLHHLGDSGYGGMALPENILAYSIAIRGRRHAYRRMAASLNR